MSAVETQIADKGRVTLNVEFDFDKAVIKKQSVFPGRPYGEGRMASFWRGEFTC